MVSAEERASEGLFDFFTRVSPHYMRPKHLQPIADVFEAARRGERVRALVFAPPRHGKTELFLHAIPWWFQDDEHERDTIAYTAYGSQFAHGKSRLARDYAIANGWQFHSEFNTVAEWRNPAFGGVLATGVDGPFVGKGCNLLIVDDPHKDRAEAESPHMRQRAYDWFKGTARQRMEPNGSIIVSMQRWHDDDLFGRLQRETGWDSIELPAISEDDEEPLWPDRWSLAELRDLRLDNEYNWSSQYCGKPRSKGGKVFEADPVRYQDPRGGTLILTVDPAGSVKTHANHWGLCAQIGDGHDSELRSDIIEVERFRSKAEQAAPKLIAFSERHGHAPLHIEGTRDGHDAADEIRRLTDGKLKIILFPARSDKLTRAQTAASAWNQGRVGVPRNAPWLAPFLREMGGFTGLGDLEDDQVDAFVHGFNILHARSRIQVTPKAPPPQINSRYAQTPGRGFGG